MSGKRLNLLHPFLFALSPTIFIYAHNINQISFGEVLPPIAILLCLVVVLLLFLRLFFHDIAKAGLGVSICFFFLCAYGFIFDAIRLLLQSSPGYLIHACLMPVMLFGLIYSGFLIKKTRGNLISTAKFLNIVSATFIIISVTNIAIYKLRNLADSNYIVEKENISSQTTTPPAGGRLPDIYYIILDRYSSSASLKEFYDFDNSEFIDYLERHGFYVASQSHSNYSCTNASLTSSLNMKHITYLGKELGERTNDWTHTYPMLADYPIWRFLKSKGYTFVHLGSDWLPVSRNKYADMNFNLYFGLAAYKTIMLGPITRLRGFTNPYWEKYKKVQYQFDKLSSLPDINGPTFVFAHILVPHDPYVFDANGNFLSSEQEGKRSYRENYLGQIVFINRKVEALINKLQSESDPQPIIVLQSDEGQYPQNGLDMDCPSNAQCREKMGILNAYYLPYVDENGLYPSITPVNSFRVIFNLYFGTNFELLPDEIYISSNNHHIYRFINITDKLK